MNDLEKLLRKLDKKRRRQLESLMEPLERRDFQGFDIVKLSGHEKYRVKKGHFRVVFHYEKGIFTVDRIRLRDEDTYKNL